MNGAIDQFCNELLTAGVNGAYQGAWLVLLVWAGLKLGRRTNAATRHAVLFATLLMVAALPAAHWFSARAQRGAGNSAVPSGEVPGQESRSPAAAQSAREGLGDLPWGGSEGSEPARDLVPAPPGVLAPVPAEGLADAAARAPAAGARSSADEGEALAAVESEGGLGGQVAPTELPATVRPLGRVESGTPRWLASGIGRVARFLAAPVVVRQLELPSGLGPVLTGCWAMISSLLLLRLAAQFHLVHALKRCGLPPAEALRGRFDALCVEFGLRQRPRLLVSDQAAVPLAAGFSNPAVLLPEKLAAGADGTQLDPILRHELAHLARHDDWANLVQQGIKGLMFFHPAVWFLSRQLTFEREVACDDRVLATVANSRGYALLLTEFAGRVQGRPQAAAPAGWSSQSQLKERINMILNSNRNTSPRLARARLGLLTVGAMLAAMLALRAGPRVLLGTGESALITPQAATAGESELEQPDALASANAPLVQVALLSKDPDAEVLLGGSDDEPAALAAADPAEDESETGPLPKPGPAPEPVPVPPQPRGKRAPALRIAPVAPVALALTPPCPPIAAVPGVPAVPPVPGVPPVPVAAPAPPAPALAGPMPLGARPGRAEREDRGIERRLERVERMVEELIARDKKRRGEAGADVRFDLKLQSAEHEASKANEKMQAHAQAMAELAAGLKDTVNAETARALQDVERAMVDAKRAARDAERARGENRLRSRDEQSGARQALEEQRKALEAARRELERQLRSIEKEISGVEREAEKAEREREAEKAAARFEREAEKAERKREAREKEAKPEKGTPKPDAGEKK